MTSKLIRNPLLTLAAFAFSGSIALAQTTPAQQTPPVPAASAPAPEAAPVERRPPPDPGMEGRPGMRPGMMKGAHNGGDNLRRGAMMHRPGDEMGEGFRITPPGMWWKNPAIVQRLTLTPDQTKKMDDIFQQSRLQLIDLKANVERQNVLLEPMLSANPPNTAKTLAQIDKVAQARADLEKADARMLLGIRGVLTPDQWTKLHTQAGWNRGPEGDRTHGGPRPGGFPAGAFGPHGNGGAAGADAPNFGPPAPPPPQ